MGENLSDDDWVHDSRQHAHAPATGQERSSARNSQRRKIVPAPISRESRFSQHPARVRLLRRGLEAIHTGAGSSRGYRVATDAHRRADSQRFPVSRCSVGIGGHPPRAEARAVSGRRGAPTETRSRKNALGDNFRSNSLDTRSSIDGNIASWPRYVVRRLAAPGDTCPKQGCRRRGTRYTPRRTALDVVLVAVSAVPVSSHPTRDGINNGRGTRGPGRPATPNGVYCSEVKPALIALALNE